MNDKIITQIGSLPYKHPKAAVDYSSKHDIPFLPELPKLGDAILDYVKRPGKLSCLKLFKKCKFETVKVQCVGPTTLINSGYGENEAIEIILKHTAAIIEGLDAKKIILFLDEPALGQTGLAFRELWAPIFESFQVIWGVHCCDNADWDRVFESGVKIVSFDASRYDLTRYPKYGDFRQNGGRISWGVQKKEDVKDFRPGDLLTLPCGMGTKLFTVKDCRKELKKLRVIAEEIHR